MKTKSALRTAIIAAAILTGCNTLLGLEVGDLAGSGGGSTTTLSSSGAGSSSSSASSSSSGVGGAGGMASSSSSASSSSGVPTCVDGVKNGAETDVDCGGASCAKCAAGKACLSAADCQSGACGQAGACNPCPESDLFLMQDISGSTSTAAVGGTRLDISRFAIESFMAEAKSSGLGLGIGYHPIPAPGFPGTDSCAPADYAVPAVAIALLPGVSPTITSSLTAQMPTKSSPVAIGLEGGLMYAKSYATANPTHKVAMVLITDGMPNECTPAMDQTDMLPVASQYAAGAPPIPTYMIGLGTGAAGDVAQAQLDAVAQAGGTGTGHLTNSTGEIQTALEQIRDAIKLCP